jgi:C4-dicarboxylate-specific signal transduction histidine kinase
MNTEAQDREEHLRADLQFFGRIMANVSHEFNNVITIIGELSGLLQDLAGLAERGRPLPAEKLEQVTAKINLHTVRGKELISNMNRFSHGVDEEVHSLDLRESIDNLSVLTHRLLERREATLAFTAPESEVPITCDPFLVQRALFCSWELAMDADAPSPALELVIRPEHNSVDILVSGVSGGEGITSREEWRELSVMAGRLGGRVTVDRIDDGFTIRISLPAHLDAGT